MREETQHRRLLARRLEENSDMHRVRHHRSHRLISQVQNEKEKAAQDEREQKESEFSISRELLESLVIQLRENSQKFDQSNSE
jgi:hypothetical protein